MSSANSGRDGIKVFQIGDFVPSTRLLRIGAYVQFRKHRRINEPGSER